MPVVDASPAALRGYGRLVDNPAECEVEIVRWPQRGSRPIDADTGDQGGTTEGVFVSEWQGDILYGRNDAVGGHYILGYAEPPEVARSDHAVAPRRVMLWHANYHPDGGQLFFPLDARPFLVPLALPGDDVTPGALRLLSLRRQPRPLHPSRHLARGRVRPGRNAALLRQAGRGARPRLGRFRARVRVPARSADRRGRGRRRARLASRDVGQHARPPLSRHDLRREPRPGDRLRRRRLPARHGALGGRHPARARPAPARAPRATSPSGRKTTRSRSSPASSRAGRPERRSRS